MAHKATAAGRPSPPRRAFLKGALRFLCGGLLSPLTLHAMSGDGNRTGNKAQETATVFLCGDVMTGRGIDQVLPHPVEPRLFESYVTSAVGYVRLAEEMHGEIPKPVDFDYPWGEALAELQRRRPDARIINLETSVTRSDDAWPKGINYRMSPENFGCITAAGIDCCVLANNHVLDWGPAGLVDTLETIGEAGIAGAGAGRDRDAAARPAVLPLPGHGRLLVFACAGETSGVPREWAARKKQPGVNWIPDLSPKTAAALAERAAATRRAEDRVIVSIHWGSNWGYDIPEEQRRFAHALIDSGAVDIIHGHSSHHPRAMEVYRERLILYGCGDFINDYEGIQGYEAYRDDLVLMYLPELRRKDGALAGLTLVPFQIRRFRLQRASSEDTAWLAEVMDLQCRKFGAGIKRLEDDTLILDWGGTHAG